MNDVDKGKACIELAGFIVNTLVDISKGIQKPFKNVCRPYVTGDEAKEAIDAMNNAIKLFSKDKNEIELCDKLSEIAKAFIRYLENQDNGEEVKIS